MGIMQVMGTAGDTEIAWDPDDSKSVETAEKEFKRLKKEGYEFFEAETVKGKQVKRFSKKLGKIIAAPATKTKAERGTSKRPAAMGGGPNDSMGLVRLGNGGLGMAAPIIGSTKVGYAPRAR